MRLRRSQWHRQSGLARREQIDRDSGNAGRTIHFLGSLTLLCKFRVLSLVAVGGLLRRTGEPSCERWRIDQTQGRQEFRPQYERMTRARTRVRVRRVQPIITSQARARAIWGDRANGLTQRIALGGDGKRFVVRADQKFTSKCNGDSTAHFNKSIVNYCLILGGKTIILANCKTADTR